MLAGSFYAGQKNAGHLTLSIKASSLSLNNLQSPKEGWNPTIALNPPNLEANLNAAQTPQQNPIA